ncbi:MAG: pantoate--beta-alanine ligase [Mobiluncus porci]|uniref:pantoate--beta-alanine ligase n=1 Tax=Mobiluncus porci TaxID=2652278 RepID=UPI0023F2C1A4|nr:pantoate--beta-alanine ligase [Mobiluncus porci]MDD7541339.1 pantoate--beta-alanine ligase [Mobiluncus porci]MDY5747822.1 pantoate--beta-alanine ligase [Mobiluncus porci]
MKILQTREELKTWRENVSGTLGLVMTMGALHEGHLDLVRAAKAAADTVLVTVFVNPTQFAPGEDFDKYPRDLEGDAAKLRAVGADALFAPTPEVMYPQGEALVSFNPGPAAKILEGKTRPTHFAGVLLVVGKMFHLTRPDVACFGKKDAQQLAIVTQMVRDLDFPLEILPVEIRREEDGLAMSSRNRYLSEAERASALNLSQSLQWGLEHASELGSDRIAAAVRGRLEEIPGIEVDYVALVNPRGFVPITEVGFRGPATLALAAKVGATRLIDNMDLVF